MIIFFCGHNNDGIRQHNLDSIGYQIDNINWFIENNFDIKSVFRKIFNYYSVYENLNFTESLRYLRDYHNMLLAMGITGKEKYPRYLKSNHDIITSEFKSYSLNIDLEEFKAKVDNKLEYKNKKKFQVLAPRHPDEIRDEGEKLGHCVGSYIKRIIEGTTQIMFVRQRPKESFVTIEIKGGVIIQASAYGNTRPPVDVMKFLKEDYAINKNLLVRC